MLSDNTGVFYKENIDGYLKELAKEFRKLNGKIMPAEITLIGGAAILANYGFRDVTTDIDAVIHASSSMKEAINRVGDKYNLPNGWLNDDFIHTGSYTPKLEEVSVYYRTFSNILQIRTISAEYLIAMKLCSGRRYKKDMSDVIGILIEHEKRGTPITEEMVDQAVNRLYGGWESITADSHRFIQDIFKKGNYEQIYTSVCGEERKSQELIVDFERNYPGITTESNVNDILTSLEKKKVKRRKLIR